MFFVVVFVCSVLFGSYFVFFPGAKEINKQHKIIIDHLFLGQQVWIMYLPGSWSVFWTILFANTINNQETLLGRCGTSYIELYIMSKTLAC